MDETIAKFKKLAGIVDHRFDNDINGFTQKVLYELNIFDLLEKTVNIFKIYLFKYLNGEFTGNQEYEIRLLGLDFPQTLNPETIAQTVSGYSFSFDSIDYNNLINLATIAVLYNETINNKLLSDRILLRINDELVLSYGSSRLVDRLFRVNAANMVLSAVSKIKNLTKFISKDDIINLIAISSTDDFWLSKILSHTEQLGLNRALEEEDEFDRRNGKLTKECDISYLELENKAKLALEKASLINLCSVITEFANLIELEGPCNQYSIEDLKDVTKQLIKILAKTKLCLLIKLLSIND
jgi:hypothetical protein